MLNRTRAYIALYVSALGNIVYACAFATQTSEVASSVALAALLVFEASLHRWFQKTCACIVAPVNTALCGYVTGTTAFTLPMRCTIAFNLGRGNTPTPTHVTGQPASSSMRLM